MVVGQWNARTTAAPGSPAAQKPMAEHQDSKEEEEEEEEEEEDQVDDGPDHHHLHRHGHQDREPDYYQSMDPSSGRGNGFVNARHAGSRPKASKRFRLGARVEREIDRLWFPGTIVGFSEDNGTYELEYDDEEHHREADVDADEIRLLEEHDPQVKLPVKSSGLTTPQKEKLQREALLLATDYDPNKVPTVVLHQRGESHSVSGYIINGLENNIAAGNGLRGIRWLRVNTG